MNLQPWKSSGSVPVIVAGLWDQWGAFWSDPAIHSYYQYEIKMYSVHFVLFPMIHQCTCFQRKIGNMMKVRWVFECHSCWLLRVRVSLKGVVILSFADRWGCIDRRNGQVPGTTRPARAWRRLPPSGRIRGIQCWSSYGQVIYLHHM